METAFDITDWKATASIQSLANTAVDLMWALAQATDPDYSNDCGLSSNTNPGPVGDRQQLVRLLHKAALEINASGLCDSGEWECWVGYDW